MKVGYLGPKGTFSYEACNEYCTENQEKVEYKTIPETIIALNNNEIDECIVPIENSLQGCVTDSIDTLIRNDNIKVKREVLVEIKQNLMAKSIYDFDDIKIVYSHPQALAQCKSFLEKYLSNAKQVAVESTAYAAKKVSEENETCACICNKSCLEEYNLKLLKESIQDNEFNKTKFWVLSKKENIGDNFQKMSMIFSVKDKPGALYNVLEIFNKYNLNLTKIESRPAKTVLGEYYFLIDVSIENGNEEKAINDIKEKGIYIRVLGKY